MNESTDWERVALATLPKKLKCLNCDREITIYVPVAEADLLAELTPAYCAQCLTWIQASNCRAVFSEMVH